MTILLTCLFIMGFFLLITFLYALLKISKISDERAGYEEGHVRIQPKDEV